jgi:hypothetical protein
MDEESSTTHRNKKNQTKHKMNKETLNQKITQLQQEFELQKKEVMQQYCDANNPYKIGDKFSDHIGTIIVEKIRYSYGDRPCCVYFGTELKKDGTPRKDNNKRQAWQSNDVSVSVS